MTARPSTAPVSTSVMRSPPALLMMVATVSPEPSWCHPRRNVGQGHGAGVIEHGRVVDRSDGDRSGVGRSRKRGGATVGGDIDFGAGGAAGFDPTRDR